MSEQAKEQELAGLWEGRYFVTVTAEKFKGFEGVNFRLFRHDMTDEEATDLLASCEVYEWQYPDDGRGYSIWPYMISQVQETFDAEQVEAIKECFSAWPGTAAVEAELAMLPRPDGMGICALPVGGYNDFLMFDRGPDYTLPFSVWGYYDLRPYMRAKGIEYPGYCVQLSQRDDGTVRIERLDYDEDDGHIVWKESTASLSTRAD